VIKTHFKTGKGFSIIEVLVSVFLLSFLTCVWIKINRVTIDLSYKSHFRTTAMIQGKNLLALLTLTHTLNVNLDNLLLNEWKTFNRKTLPHVHEAYYCGSNQCTVKLKWTFKTLQHLTVTASNDFF
jgi:hypothetical protein